MDVEHIKQLISNEEYDKAIDLLQSQIKTEANSGLYFLRGTVKYKQGNLLQAIEDFTLCIAEKENAEFYFQRGMCLHHLGNNKEALLDFDKSVELEPKNPFWYSCRAYIHSKLKNIDEAITDYEKAVELDPTDAIAHNNLGMLQENKGYFEKSKESFKKSDEIIGYDSKEFNLKNPDITPRDEEFERKPIDIIKEVFSTKSGFKEYWKFVKGGLK